jgi:hypothetical protein
MSSETLTALRDNIIGLEDEIRKGLDNLAPLTTRLQDGMDDNSLRNFWHRIQDRITFLRQELKDTWLVFADALEEGGTEENLYRADMARRISAHPFPERYKGSCAREDALGIIDHDPENFLPVYR